MNPTTHESRGRSPGQPGAGPALIGAGLGILLVYLGMYIPFTVLKWAIIGIGAVFVVVMTSYALALVWKSTAGVVRPVVNRARGHVRYDPQLGTMTRDVRAHCWVATVRRGDRSVEFVVEGDDEPSPSLLATARELAARLETLERDVQEYGEHEAQREMSIDPEMAADIRALRMSAVQLRSPDNPHQIVIDFAGTDEMRYWSCDYAEGKLSGLTFDT